VGLYQEAQTELTRLQAEFPNWNREIINMRLSYIAGRIATLMGAMPAERARPMAAPESVPPVDETANVTNQLQAAWQRLRAMEADRVLLQARLREALAAQPATVDPRELARAGERVRELLKENEVLRADLDKKMEDSPAARSSEVQRLKKTIADLKMELEAQARAATSLLAESGLKQKEETKRAAALTVERDTLKKQMESGTAGKEFVRLNAENEKLRKSLADAQAEAQSAATLKRQVKEAQSTLTRTEEEKQKLQERLQTVSSNASSNTAAGDAELRKQLEQAQASLRIVEEERNALKKQASAASAISDTEARLKDENSRLQSQVDQIKAAGDATALTRQLDQVRETLKSTESERDSLKTQVALADPSQKNEKLREENDGLRKDLAGARTTAKKTGAELESAQKELTRTQARLAATEKERQSLVLALEENEKNLEAARKAQAVAEKQAKKSETQAATIRQLQQENETLLKTLDETSDLARKFESDLEKAQKNLNRTQARLAATEQERKALEQAQEDNEKRLAEARKDQAVTEKLSKKYGTDLEGAQKDLNLAQARLVEMEKERKALEQAQEDNEKQLADARKAQAAAEKLAKQETARARDMEKEQAKLRQKLADADQELARKNTKNLDAKFASLNEEVLKLRSRLDVYESKPVPYTPEELALFQKPAPSQVDLTKSDATTPSHPGHSTAVLTTAGRNGSGRSDKGASAEAPADASLVDTGKDVRSLVAEAAQLAESGKLDEADKKAQEALALNPGSGSAQSFLGYVRYSQGRFDEALDALTKASRIRQDDPGVLNMIGLVMINKGQRGQAETSFRRALQASPGFADAHRNLATLYLSQTPPLPTLARWHYQKAVNGGAPRSEEFEKKLEAAASAASTP
jgi:chromosome segregation ATPase